MLVFTRLDARRFRAAARKCLNGRARGPDPLVVLRRGGGRVTLTATFPEVTLELAVPDAADPTRTGDPVLVVPMALVDEAAGSSRDRVDVRSDPSARDRKGTAWWAVGDGTRSVPVELILPGKQHDPLPRPLQPLSVPARFLTALHACGQVAARDDGRFALTRVQVRGKAGTVIGTDGKVAVICRGFTLSFAEDLLLPAVPLFGCPEVKAETEVRVGRTESHVVVSAGQTHSIAYDFGGVHALMLRAEHRSSLTHF